MSRTLPVAKGSMAEEAAASVTSPNLTTDPVAFGPGRARRSPATSANFEPGQPLRFLLEGLDVVHFGAVRALVSEAHHTLDRVRLALEDRLDRALGGVAYPAAHSFGGGLAASGVAKEDPLHLAVHDHAPSDRLARHLARPRQVVLAPLHEHCLVAPEVAHRHLAPSHLRQRAVAAVGDLPDRPSHGRRRVASPGAEAALGAAPQTADPALAARRACLLAALLARTATAFETRTLETQLGQPLGRPLARLQDLEHPGAELAGLSPVLGVACAQQPDPALSGVDDRADGDLTRLAQWHEVAPLDARDRDARPRPCACARGSDPLAHENVSRADG